MTSWNEEEVLKTLEEIGKRAVTDAAFRKICLENPGEAVKMVSGKELPAGLKIQVVDNAGAHMTFVLPDMVSDGELNEEDLDNVAGGFGYGPPTQKCGPGGGGFPGGGGGGFPGGGGGGGSRPTFKCGGTGALGY